MTRMNDYAEEMQAMIRRSRFLLFPFWRMTMSFGLGTALLSVCPGAVGADDHTGGHLLIRLLPGASITELASDYDLHIVGQVEGRDLYELRLHNGDHAEEIAQELSADSRVQFAEKETQVELPEVHGKPFHMAFDFSIRAEGYLRQNAYTQIDLGTPVPAATGAAVTVAILDTGVAFSHPGLKGRLLSGYNTLDSSIQPSDIDDGKTNISVGHGTMVAGIVARTSPHASIMPIRVLDADGSGTMLHVLQGLHYAVTHGAKVINMSFGTPERSLVLEDALAEAHDAGIVLVASAGNEASSELRYPAACQGVLAVASVDKDNKRSSFSNYGSYISLVAPGSSIRSTYWTGGYATWSGTSFSSPFVAAEASELLAHHSDWDAGEIGRRIGDTAHKVDTLNPGFDRMLGAGLIDMKAALANSDGGRGGKDD